jgi:hypothetical protein
MVLEQKKLAFGGAEDAVTKLVETKIRLESLSESLVSPTSVLAKVC